MSPRRVVSEREGGGGRVALTAALVVIAAAAAMLIVRARPRPEPFDPRSSRPDGTRALVLLLRRFGASVEISRNVPNPGAAGRVVLLDDRLVDAQRSAFEAFVAAGGLAVVADPSSELHGATGTTVVLDTRDTAGTGDTGEEEPAGAEVDRGICTVDALRHLRSLGLTTNAVDLMVAPGARHCFGDDRHAVVVTRQIGSGVVVGIGDQWLWTNSALDHADNGGLATALLAPSGHDRVTFLLGGGAAKSVADIGTGEQTLSDLVRPGVWMALVQLGLAFVLFAMARGIRPGAPVNEPRPVPLTGSSFVAATGRLMQRAGHTERAGWLLRAELYRAVCEALGQPTTTATVDLDRAATARLGAPPGLLAELLDSEPADDRSLLALSNRITDFRASFVDGGAVLSTDEPRLPSGASR